MAFINFLFSWLDLKSILILISVVLMTRWFLRQPRNLPPGPFGWPILGFLPQMIYAMYRGEKIHEVLMRQGKKHGKMTSLNIFGVPVIVLNDAALIREAFQIPSLCDKGFNNALQIRLCGRALMDHTIFNQYRKFSASTLRHFGLGTSKFEDAVIDELQILIEQLRNHHNCHAVNPLEFLYFATENMMSPILFGKRFEYTDEKARDLLRLNWAAFQLLGQGGFEIFLPFTLPTSANRTLWSASKQLCGFIKEQQQRHQKVLDPENPSDYTDVYLKEVALEASADSQNSYLQMDNAAGQLFFLFMAVANPVAAFTYWAILYLADHPDVQERVHKELDSVIGRNRLPRLSDQNSLPYLKAVIYELQRVVTLVPLGHMHSASADVQFHGYTIPKGSVIIGNLWYIHNDPDLWPEPEKFKPERFLNEKGEFVFREGYVPYGLGRRICLGENLAKIETYLILAHLMHHFTLKKPQDQTTFDFKGTAGLVRSPTPHKIEFIERE